MSPLRDDHLGGPLPRHREVEVLVAAQVIDRHVRAGRDAPADHEVRHRELEVAAEDADQLPRAQLGLAVRMIEQERARRTEQLASETALPQPAGHPIEPPVEDLAEMLLLEPVEHDEPIQARDEILAEVLLGLRAAGLRDPILLEAGSGRPLESDPGAFLEDLARAEARGDEDHAVAQASEPPAG